VVEPDELYPVVLVGSTTPHLAFLGRINADLLVAGQACERYLTEVSGTGDPLTEAMALEFSIIAYGRCFESGSAPGVQNAKLNLNDVIPLGALHLRTHKLFHRLRGSYVGHSGNSLNRTTVTGNIRGTQTTSPVLDSIFAINVRRRPPNEDVRAFARLISALRAEIASRVEVQKALVRREFEVDVRALLSNPQPQFSVVDVTLTDYSQSSRLVDGQFEIPIYCDEAESTD
jgi:hypothetical protein